MSCILYTKASYAAIIQSQILHNACEQVFQKPQTQAQLTDWLFNLNVDAYEFRYNKEDRILSEVIGAQMDDEVDYEFTEQVTDMEDAEQITRILGRIEYQCSDINPTDADQLKRFAQLQMIKEVVEASETAEDKAAKQARKTAKAKAIFDDKNATLAAEIAAAHPWAFANGLPLDYLSIAYYLKSELHLLDNKYWMSDREEEWKALPAAFQAEIKHALAFIQSERAWASELVEEFGSRVAQNWGHFVAVADIVPPKSRKYGQAIPNERFYAEIEPNKSITIFGFSSRREDGAAFKQTFKVGDKAVYGSYNLIYTGKIIAIGKGTVTIHKEGYSKASRLSLYEFCARNDDFNAERISKHNHEESYCI